MKPNEKETNLNATSYGDKNRKQKNANKTRGAKSIRACGYRNRKTFEMNERLKIVALIFLIIFLLGAGIIEGVVLVTLNKIRTTDFKAIAKDYTIQKAYVKFRNPGRQ